MPLAGTVPRLGMVLRITPRIAPITFNNRPPAPVFRYRSPLVLRFFTGPVPYGTLFVTMWNAIFQRYSHLEDEDHFFKKYSLHQKEWG
jgi:hypothetical protein